MSSGDPEPRYAWAAHTLEATHGPFVELTRHFLQRLVRPPFLTEAGADSFRTVLAGILAAALALGMFLPRVFRKRYTLLSYQPAPEPYLEALVADQIFVMSVIMLLAGLAVVGIAHALLPDETDYVVLSPLPVTREFIFLANAAAVALVLGPFTLASVSLFGVGFSIVSTGRWATESVTARVLAHLPAGIGASLFVYATLFAIHGAIGFIAPRRMVRRLSLALQAGLAFGLIASLPVVASIPGLSRAIATNAGALLLAPPAWFAGFEHWLLGSDKTLDAHLAGRAAVGLAVATAVALACYAIAYRRFDRAASRAASRPSSSTAFAGNRDLSRALADRSGILAFAAFTIARSRVHQLVVLGVMACGVALVLNGMMAAVAGRWLHARVVSPLLLQRAAISMPLILIFTSVLALRAAFRLPADLRANWIFRITDDPSRRPPQVDAVETALVLYGIVPALAAALPVQLIVLGTARAAMVLCAATLLGALLIQIVMEDWRRIPFTCAYLPGRRLFAYTVAIFLGTFFGFVSVGGAFAAWGATHPSRFVLVVGVLLTAFSWLRRRRLRVRGEAPMEFADDPDSTIRLGLSS